MMIIDRVGNWNPQLFREWKGRLTGRNLAIATVLSLLVQFVIGMVLHSEFPAPIPPEAPADWGTRSRYCTGQAARYQGFKCLPDGLGYWQIDWQHFWLDIATWSSVAILVTLLLGGVYLLIDDLAKEQKRGTLNFIRLSPQSSESILIGKLLGVPVLVYVAVALVLPLQIVSAIAAGLPIDTLFRFYLLAAAGCSLLYNAALLFGFLGGTAGLGCLVVGLLHYPYLFTFWLFFIDKNEQFRSTLQWFYLPVGQEISWFQIFIFSILMLGTFGFWQAVNRRFRNPSATILSKLQSYRAMVCVQVLLLGSIFSDNTSFVDHGFGVVTIINLLTFLSLVPALSPERQAVQDWARYHHLQGDRRSAVREWIFGEKSPAVVAIAVNLAITAIIWTPGILFLSTLEEYSKGWDRTIVGLLATANIIWICAAIAQVMLLLKNRKRRELALFSVVAAICLPAILLSQLSTTSSSLLMFSVFGVGLLNNFIVLSTSTILLGFLGQVCVMTALSWQLNRILHKMGDSDTKKLLQERRSLPS